MLDIKYTEIALKQLKKISTSNLIDVERIIIGIEKYANSPLEKHDIKHRKEVYND